MKNILSILPIVSLVFLFSCKTDAPQPNEKVPDLVVSLEAKKGSNVVSSISFEYKEQQSNSNSAANGSYNSAANLFGMNVLGNVGSVGPSFGLAGATGGISTGTYNVMPVTGNPGETWSTFTTADGTSYGSTSGNFKITKSDFFAAANGIETYFLDIEVNVTLTNNADANDMITVTGTLKGVTIGVN